MASRRGRRILFRVGVLLAVLLLGLVAAELVLRNFVEEVYLVRRHRDGGLFLPYEPGVEADLLRDEFRNRYRINQLGCRDRLDRTAARVPAPEPATAEPRKRQPPTPAGPQPPWRSREDCGGPTARPVRLC